MEVAFVVFLAKMDPILLESIDVNLRMRSERVAGGLTEVEFVVPGKVVSTTSVVFADVV